MAQITISEAHYQELLELARARGVTPDVLADTLIEEQLIAADQRAFWGEDIEARIATSLHALAQRPRHVQTDDEFLSALQERMKAPDDANA